MTPCQEFLIPLRNRWDNGVDGVMSDGESLLKYIQEGKEGHKLNSK